MKHPLLALANENNLNSDDLRRSLNPAKATTANTKDNPRKLSDGGGLYLLVLPKGKDGKCRRLWRYKYRINGVEGLYAIGAMPEIGLADARRIHRAARWLVERGIHPRDYAKEKRASDEVERLRGQANTFAVICENWTARDAAKLAPSSIAQRNRELKNDVLPVLAAKPIAEITKSQLTNLLQKIETRAPEVARNVRQYLTGIFEYAIDAGLVTGSPVPGRKILKPRNQKPHAALSLAEVGKFLRAVDAAGCNPQTRIAIWLLLLTAVRKSELINAEWKEFDLDKGEWSIPAGRMKMREAHWVPLSKQAVKLLRELHQHSSGDLLFPNIRDPRRPMAGRSLNALLERIGYLEQAKPHGFRSVFSTHANSTGCNPDVIEKCLAHKHKDMIRAKYNRNEYRNEQAEVMQHWANVVTQWFRGAEVVPIGKKKRQTAN
jgi:integrase